MDAHTLNAWTRFALQKGGIGSCTALIDNPASDAEDLMFMQGEKIVVLRRLEDEAEGSAGSSRRSQPEADAWYLGYCEGVVGRFKGAHVQFHGKLKKPVLMRRSGVGQIRESSTKPMSKAEAASLHISQVPPGIPVTAVDSDDEGQSFDSHKRTGPARNSGASLNGSTSQQAGASLNKYPSTSRLRSARAQANLGVTTPPLSDENHARDRNGGRAVYDSDSEASETVLPWARGPDEGQEQRNEQSRGMRPPHIGVQASNLPPSPISSTESPVSSKQNTADVTGSMSTPRINVPNGHLSTTSSLSTSATSESEEDHRRREQTFSIYDLYGRDSVAFPNFSWREQAGRLTDSKSGESLSVQPGPHSRPGSGLRPRSPVSGQTTPEPRTPVDRKPPSEPTIPVALRSPSGRRPNAAPPPNTPGLSIATSLRRKVEATSNTTSSPPLPSSSTDSQPEAKTPTTAAPYMGFDPKRRPSAAGRLAGALPGAGRGTPDSMRGAPTAVAMDGAAPRSDRSMMPPPSSVPVAPRPMQAMPQGFYPPATAAPPSAPGSVNGGPDAERDAPSPFQQTRGSFAESRRRSRSSSNLKLSVDTGLGRSSATPSPVIPGQRSPFANGYSDRSSARGSGSGPTRASSDRTSVRERVGSGMGSGMLKKNPSNPAPGLHGGMQGLSVSTNANGGHSSGQSRSPSPLSAVSGVTSVGTSASGMGMPPPPPFAGSPYGGGSSSLGTSPVGPGSPILQGPGGFGRPNFSVAPRVMSVPGAPGPGAPASSDSDRPLAFDALGFIVGTGAPVVLPREDPDAIEKWQAILAENDVAGARKSRKVRKLVEAGIPVSMRPKVWGFLANSSYRRRPGLFEQLCKASQGSKGKKGKETQYEAIEKDLDRCYPDHQLFHGQNGTGRADLEAILKAYVHYNPIVGYTQGMGLVAGLMLILMPAEDAFWLLCALLRDVHMEGYYSSGLKQLHVDGIVFGQLLQGMDAELAAKLSSIDIEPINFTPNWFLPLFVRVLPWETVLRSWDVFFYEGPTWILRVALAIVRILRDPLLNPRAVPGHGEGMRLLLHPPQQLLTPDNVLGCALSVRLKDGEIRKLSRQASKLVRQSIQPRGRAATPTTSAARSTSAPPAKR